MEMTTIPLSQLIASDQNVRKTQTAVDDLAASIEAHGLLQNLVVTRGGEKYRVEAGARRLAALQHLAANDKLPADLSLGIPCIVIEGAPEESSLAENFMREPMHPADEFEAFRTLADQGMSPADIGARFGRSEKTVQQRLSLARVSPAQVQAYREGSMTLEILMAFTLSSDFKQQEIIWDEVKDDRWDREPAKIKKRIVGEEINSATDNRLKIVTVDEYIAAGGEVARRDLFDEAGTAFLTNGPLLDELVLKRLEAVAAQVQAEEGWKWSLAQLVFPFEERRKLYQDHYGTRRKCTAEESKRLDDLDAEREAIEEKEEYGDGDHERLEAIEEEEEAIRAELLTFSDKQKKICGIVVSVGYEGIEIDRGLQRLSEIKPKKAKAGAGDAEDDDDDGAPALAQQQGKAPYSAKLVQDLTAERTVAIQNALRQDFRVALVAVVHTMIQSLNLGGAGWGQEFTGIKIHRSHPKIDEKQNPNKADLEEAVADLEGALEDIDEAIPLWDYLSARSVDELHDMLALCAALSFDSGSMTWEADKTMPADALMVALNIDMRSHWQATAANYFSKVTKADVLDVLRDANGEETADRFKNLKKGDLDKSAEGALEGRGWLPGPLIPQIITSKPVKAAKGRKAKGA